MTGGASGAEIARTTGISQSTISRWSNGEIKPSSDNLTKLAKHYPIQLAEAMQIVEAYQPPRANVVEFIQGERIVLRADVVRGELLKVFSDLELAQEFVRRIEEHDSVEVGSPLPLAEDPIQHTQGFGVLTSVGPLTEDDIDISPAPTLRKVAKKRPDESD